ncbi:MULTISPECIES: YraN family protein [unclassified Agarivorans]|uniref:YraN family protein n=1 Tax=unclassified Agarivorans TaxID=2636026 RepID=UPI0026E14FDC|nr:MULTISPECIES: YraN family protein [unclassified Agarivorans]MDO6686898.1 YraN family protein [Agarivorans sp. 3_MG-2023]MDO6716695.1 YraN family protein [Agarivorans sp. 2_MG-2023]
MNKGQAAEQQAADYLKQQGLTLVEQNYHCRRGEIDLICKQADTWVFVEVKYRKSRDFGGAVAAVDQHKIRRILLSAQHYLQQQNLNQFDTAMRFDVVAIQEQAPHLEWFQNAFGE